MRWHAELKQKRHLVEKVERGLLGRRDRLGPVELLQRCRRRRIGELVERLNLVPRLDLLYVGEVVGIEQLGAANDGC